MLGKNKDLTRMELKATFIGAPEATAKAKKQFIEDLNHYNEHYESIQVEFEFNETNQKVFQTIKDKEQPPSCIHMAGAPSPADTPKARER